MEFTVLLINTHKNFQLLEVNFISMELLLTFKSKKALFFKEKKKLKILFILGWYERY
jgi:hypothetical protein